VGQVAMGVSLHIQSKANIQAVVAAGLFVAGKPKELCSPILRLCREIEREGSSESSWPSPTFSIRAG